MKKGLFVTFEGGEGAGKSTLAASLRDAFKAEGRDLVFTREPGGTPFGEELRTLLLHHKSPVANKAELFLFLASRIQHIEEVIQPAITRGALVLCDRFNDSTIAYQGQARGLGMDYVASCCKLACGDFTPDITFFVDLDPSIGLHRTVKRRKDEAVDRLEKEALEFHQKVRQGYQSLAKQYPERIITLDGTLEPHQLFQQAISILKSQL
jgi:dTMP kinase